MSSARISCFYHPTTIVMVDDDAHFLKNITLNFGPDIPYVLYQDAEEALKYLKKLKNQSKLVSRAVVADLDSNEYSDSNLPINLKIKAILDEVYNKNQFSEVSLVVVDYAMPKINGAQLLEEIADVPIKKLMLTGQADEAIAVKLFNTGKINKFMLKGGPDTEVMLNQSIHDLQNEYIYDISDQILKRISGLKKSWINDVLFSKFFNDLCTANAVSSYYLIDLSGSFLLLDKKGVPSWLLVTSEEEANAFAKQASHEGASANVVELLTKGEKIAYFPNFDEYVRATQGHWEKYLYPAKTLKGKQQNYRYSLVKDLNGFPLNKRKILSLDDYMQNMSH